MGTNNNNLYRVAKWIWVLSWYILFPGQKYLSSIVVFHSLLPERPFYCQSSLPCTPFYLNFGYRCLQLLYPWCTYHKYISHIFIIKSNSKGGEPLTFSATGKFGGDWGIAVGKQSQEREKELEWLIIILLERFDELSDETADKLAADLLEKITTSISPFKAKASNRWSGLPEREPRRWSPRRRPRSRRTSFRIRARNCRRSSFTTSPRNIWSGPARTTSRRRTGTSSTACESSTRNSETGNLRDHCVADWEVEKGEERDAIPEEEADQDLRGQPRIGYLEASLRQTRRMEQVEGEPREEN